MVDVPRSSLVIEAVQIAESFLSAGEELAPAMITDRWGDRRVEEFEREDLGRAQARLAEFLRTAAGDEACVLVYVGHVDPGEQAIVIEHGRPGQQEAEVFVQRFRSRRTLLRGFKLLGDPTPVDQIESAP